MPGIMNKAKPTVMATSNKMKATAQLITVRKAGMQSFQRVGSPRTTLWQILENPTCPIKSRLRNKQHTTSVLYSASTISIRATPLISIGISKLIRNAARRNIHLWRGSPHTIASVFLTDNFSSDNAAYVI